MSVFGRDTFTPVTLLRKKRVRELFLETIPEEDVLQLANGTYKCTICNFVLPTIDALVSHRKGVKHRDRVHEKKQRIAELEESSEFEKKSSYGPVRPLSMLPSQEQLGSAPQPLVDKTQRLLTNVKYSSTSSSTSVSPAEVITTEQKANFFSPRYESFISQQKEKAKQQNDKSIPNTRKPISFSAQQQLLLHPQQKKQQLKKQLQHQQEHYQQQYQQQKEEKLYQQQKDDDNANNTTEEKQDSKTNIRAINFEEERKLKEYYQTLISSGWVWDETNGKWQKRDDAEFDSDEEEPPPPPTTTTTITNFISES